MEDSDGSITSHQQPKTSSPGGPSVTKKPPTTRSASTDSTTSTESSASSATVTSTARNVQSATKQTTKPEVPQVSNRPRGSIELVAEKKPFQSRFLPNHQTAKKDETESESSSEEETSSDDDDEEEQVPTSGTTVNGSRRDSIANRSSRDDAHSSSRVGGYSSPTYARDSDDSRSAVTSSIRSRASQNNDYGQGSSR